MKSYIQDKFKRNLLSEHTCMDVTVVTCLFSYYFNIENNKASVRILYLSILLISIQTYVSIVFSLEVL